MGLSFLVPAFLAGLAALLVPIVLHLRHRDREKPLRFPSLMFLERLPIRTSQRRRLTNWPLLLMRALALALLVLAFSRPFVSQGDAAEGNRRARAVVVLLDRSLSMGHADVWPAARDSIVSIVAALGPEDRIGLLVFDTDVEVAQPLAPDGVAVLSAFDATTPVARASRIAPALRAARELLRGVPDAAGEVLVVSDLQRSSAIGMAGITLPANLSVRAVPVQPASLANVAVLGVAAERVMADGGPSLAVQAQVRAFAIERPRTVQAVLEIDGRTVGSQDITFATSGEQRVSFPVVAASSGALRGRVTIDEDPLAADDTLHFVVPPDAPLRVVLMAPADVTNAELLHFERALQVQRAPAMRVERRRPGTLDAEALLDAALVMWWDLLPTDRESEVLTTWVEGGGGSVLVAGRRLSGATPDNADNAGATSTVGSGRSVHPVDVRGVADRIASRGGSLDAVQLDHPMFAAFREAPTAITESRFLRYANLAARDSADVLARFDDGRAAVVEQRRGAGRAVAIAVPLDTRFGDLPLQPAYAPLVRHLVLHASGHDAREAFQSTGSRWLLPRSIRSPVVTRPDGSVDQVANDSSARVVMLDQAGSYTVHDGRTTDDPVAVLAANAPAEESDLLAIPDTELLLGVTPAEGDSALADGPRTPIEIERRQNLWGWALLAVALLLVAETLYANRGGRRTVRPRVATPTAAP